MTNNFQQQMVSQDKQRETQLCGQQQQREYTRRTRIQGKEQDCLPTFIPPSSNSTTRDRVSDQFLLQDEKNIKKSYFFGSVKTVQPTYTSVDIKIMQRTYKPVDLKPICSDLKKIIYFQISRREFHD